MSEIQIYEIPCGQGGLNYSQTISKFPIEDLTYCDNLTYEDDTWQKDGGATKKNTTVITDAPSVVGLHDFWVTSSSQKCIAATSDGKLVSVATAGIVDTLQTSLGTNKVTVFAEGLGGSTTRKLFSFNGYAAPQVTSDGVTAAALATPPTDWTGNYQPKAAVAHNQRHWGFGNSNYPHTIYYSGLNTHEVYTGTGSGTLNCYPGEGEGIVAGFSYAGRLFFWKFPRGIYWVDDSSTTIADWKCQRLTNAVGMAGPLGLAQIDSDVLFISSEGLIMSLATVQEYGDAKAAAILPEKIGGFIRDNINIDNLDRARAIYYPAKQKWMLACSSSISTVNNRMILLDLHNLKNPRYSFSTRDTAEAMAVTRNSSGVDVPMIGDNAGFIRTLDNSNRNKDSAAYTAEFITSDVELITAGSKRANLQFIEVIFRPEGTHDLTLDIYLDGVLTQTVQMSMGGAAGGVLDSFVLGTDTLGGGTIKNTRKRIAGDCRRIKIKGYNGGVNENFSISSILIGYTVGNDRP